MARSRNIKPGFFKNEELAELSPLTRILFIGLWCLADREGRLEDRPKRIRAEVLPYDDGSVDAMLDELHEAGFILRYTAGNCLYISICNFTKHQHPHLKESESTIPAPDKHQTSTRQKQGKCESSTGQERLNTDSLNLNTDSLNPIKPDAQKPRFDALRHLVDQGVDEQVARDWLTLRKAKKAAPTETAITGIYREATKASLTLHEVLTICCQRGWTGFKADWVTDRAPFQTQKQINDGITMKAIMGSLYQEPEKGNTYDATR